MPIQKTPLSKEDLAALQQAQNRFIVIRNVALLLFAAGVALILLWDEMTWGAVISGLGLLGAVGGEVGQRHSRKDFSNGTKSIVTGIVDSLEIKRASRTVTYELLEHDRVSILEKGPGSSQSYEGPRQLPTGETDLRDYVVTVENKRYSITRSDFFKLGKGQSIRMEVLDSGRVLKLTV